MSPAIETPLPAGWSWGAYQARQDALAKFTPRIRKLLAYQWARKALEDARRVLPIFERAYPDDNRPRLAIEAGEKVVELGPDAARAADAAARAAARAAHADAADAAARASGAARAAHADAARAADAAADAAARAADAAADAAANPANHGRKPITARNKIILSRV